MTCLATAPSAADDVRVETRQRARAASRLARNRMAVNILVGSLLDSRSLRGWRSWLRRRRRKHHTEAHKMNSVQRRHHEPTGCAGILRVLIPATALENLVLARRWPHRIGDVFSRIGLKPIQAPFPHVAVRVVQAP